MVSLISVCINTINRGPSGPLACPSYMCTKEKAMLELYPIGTTFVFGQFVTLLAPGLSALVVLEG